MRWSARGLAIVFVLYVGLAMSARWNWWGEIAASVRWYAGFGGLALALFALAARERAVAAAVFVFALLQLAPSAELYGPKPESRPGPSSRALCANLLWSNPLATEEIAQLRAGGPELVALFELSPSARAAVRALRDVYADQLVWPVEDANWGDATWGLALLARVPLLDARVLEPGPGEFPVLEARAEVAGGPVLVRVAHAPDPSTQLRFEARQHFLEKLGALAWPDDALLLGDLNITSSSPGFERLIEGTALQDSRRGRGRQADWHAESPFDWVAFDLMHALGGPRIDFLERSSRPFSGSDNAAIELRFRRRSSR